MREVTQLYKTDDTLCDQKWINELVPYLLKLKNNDWYNSIVDLPEGAEIDEDLLLLWKQDKYVDTMFMT